MATDQALVDKLREHLAGTRGLAESAMFGGVGFTLRGKLLCGVMGDELLVRVDKKDYEAHVRDGAHPMVMAGKSSQSFMLVPKARVSRKPGMKKWVDRAIKFVGTLPAK